MTTPAALETELKLMVPRAALRRLSAHQLLKGSGAPRRTRMHSVYYDTPALDLWRQGIALRMRREGRRWVQTVKGGGSVHGGLHRRIESESEVRGATPDIGTIGDRDLAKLLAAPQLSEQLRPVFSTRFTRDSRMLEPEAGARVEASIDQGTIRSRNRTEPFCELELELKEGSPSQLYELALKLAEDIPLTLDDRSKAERGYAMAQDVPQKPVKARAAVLDRQMSVNDAFKAVMWANFAHLKANERGMVAGKDPEYLHQMRVALRRMRSALGVFAPLFPDSETSPLRADLKWLAASLGPARDWDVFVSETLPPIAAEFGAGVGLTEFAQRCERLRRAANLRARRAVRSARYRRLMLSLAGWLFSETWAVPGEPPASAALEGPIVGFASEELARRYGQVRKKGRKLGGLPPRELHRLRIAIKKFRYATDFFSGLYEDKATREMLNRLSRLQDILGTMNDAARVADLVAHGFDRATGRRAIEAKGILLGWSRGRAATLKGELKGAWKQFRQAEKFW